MEGCERKLVWEDQADQEKQLNMEGLMSHEDLNIGDNLNIEDNLNTGEDLNSGEELNSGEDQNSEEDLSNRQGILRKNKMLSKEVLLRKEKLLSSDEYPCSQELPLEEGDFGGGEQSGLGELPGWDVASLLRLEPVPVSLIPEAYMENPLPDKIRADLNKTAHEVTGGKTGKKLKLNTSKKKSDQPKPNRNQGLKDEQAKIATEFRENISIRKTLEGIKFFQCKLCEGSIHIFYIVQLGPRSKQSPSLKV